MARVNPMAPWHMWGNSVILSGTVLAVPPTPVGRGTVQLIRINYRRPETWTFFFGARIVAADPPASTGCDIRIRNNITIGVGRSVFQTNNDPRINDLSSLLGIAFVAFHWQIPPGPGTNLLGLPGKYTSKAIAPILEDAIPIPADAPMYQDQRVIEQIPAQDIQVNSDLIVTTVDSDQQVSVEVTAFFSPRTHVRPEWFSDADDPGRFRGSETGGT